MFLIFLFGLAVSLSPMTGLRGEAAVSLIDLAMVGTAIVALLVCLRQQAAVPAAGPYAQPWQNLFRQPVAQFLLLSIPLLGATTLLNLGELHMQYNPLGRDALSLVGAIFVSLAICACLCSTYRKALLAGFLLGACLAMYVYVGMLLSGIGYNEDGRFVGMSLNPNQTALHSLASMIVSYFVISTLPTGWRRLKLFLSLTILASLITGIASASDAFRGSAVIIIAAMTFGIFEKLFGDKVRAFAMLSFLALGGLGAIMFLNQNFISDFLGSAAQSVTFGDQDSDRIMLWNNGIAAWLERPFLGNGIGAWSGASGPFGGIEAHNSFIDWVSITGILGGALYVVCLLKIFRFSIWKEPVRYGLFFGVMLYVSFGFFFRNPIYWLIMAIIFDGYHVSPATMPLQRLPSQKLAAVSVRRA